MSTGVHAYALVIEASRLLKAQGFDKRGQAIVKPTPKPKCQGLAKRKTPKRQALVKSTDPFLVAWEAAIARENEKRAAALRAAGYRAVRVLTEE